MLFKPPSHCPYAILRCLIEVHGQGRPACEWWGLWRSTEAFYDSVCNGGYNWVTPRMSEISDKVVLSSGRNRSAEERNVHIDLSGSRLSEKLFLLLLPVGWERLQQVPHRQPDGVLAVQDCLHNDR